MKRFLKIAIISFLSIAIGSNLFAQKGNPEARIIDSLYAYITIRLEQPGGDTASFYILEAVRKACSKDKKCMKGQLYAAVERLEQHGKYQAAIPLAKELVYLAQSEEDLPAEAAALETLVRLYNFIKHTRQIILTREKLIQIYEQIGNEEDAIINKAIILEGKAWDLHDPSPAIADIEALLEQAVRLNLTGTANKIRIRLKYLYGEHGYFEKLSGIVSALEKIPVSDPLQPSEALYAFHAASGRADLLLREKRYEMAESLYQKALCISQLRYGKQNDAWSEIYILDRLGNLETQRQHYTQAKTYLDDAFEKASALNMTDLLEDNYKFKANLAEDQHQFADALFYTRKLYEYRSRVDSLSPGFDLKRYYLELETEQLELEKERQTLALQLKTTQLNYSILLVALAILLAAGLLVGFHRQRMGKRQIASQYAVIQQQAEQLKSLDAAKSRFFANVSHELRTPLTLMLGPIKSLLKGNHSPEQQEKLLNIAKQSGQQLQQLINEILDLRKLEMGKMEVQAKPTQISTFFNRYATQFESLAQNRHIDFSHETNLPVDAVANIDREKCRQILSNLLSNAFKFTSSGGWVRASCSLQGGYLHLQVADSGSGIPPEDLPRVFDRYFQSSRHDKSAEGGTGIGLALCQEYARLFGGDISVESTIGEGSVFRVEFPVTLADPGQLPQVGEVPEAIPAEAFGMASAGVKPVASPSGPSGQSAQKPAILVVEDNPELLDYIRLVLEEKYHVVTAGNGQEALDGQLTANCQLIISDLMMPVMDGYQLLEKLKSDDATRHIPVIMLTARAEAKDKLKALRIGVDDYLTKPFDEEELLVRIENLLVNHAVRRATAEEVQTAHGAPDISQPDKEWLENFETYVQGNLGNDALSISFLAQEFAMSESTLLRQLKRLTGLSPQKYLLEIRLNEARRLLENRQFESIARIAYEVGYPEVRSFSRMFKERFGKLPSEMLSA